MTVWIGTSGWQYNHWRASFYPEGMGQPRWLDYYVQRFATVELNASFYRLPAAAAFAKWAAVTPPDFVMAVKASRYLTHIRRLREPEEPVALFLDRARQLGRKLGPILLQLPPNFAVDVGRLRDALAAFPPQLRLAVEFRHESWFTDEVRAVLEERGAALCLADRGERWVTATWRTADWGFVRFHGGNDPPPWCYTRACIASRAREIAERWEPGHDVWVYFNNDPEGCAIRDAQLLAAELDALGVPRTRVPEEEVRLGAKPQPRVRRGAQAPA